MTVTLRVRALLAERAMSQAELSRRSGLSLVTINAMTNGHAVQIRFDSIAALCDAFGCTPGDLFAVRRR